MIFFTSSSLLFSSLLSSPLFISSLFSCLLLLFSAICHSYLFVNFCIRRYCIYRNSMIVQGPTQERSSRFCRRFAFRFRSSVAFDHWPTHKCIRVLRRAYLMTGRQACLRANAQSASSYGCTSPLAVTTVMVFLDLKRVSSSHELRSFPLSMCVDAPESIKNCLSCGFPVFENLTARF